MTSTIAITSRTRTETSLDQLADSQWTTRELTPTERAVVELVRNYERPDAEIAQAAGCSVQQAAWARRFMEGVTSGGGIPHWPERTGHAAINVAKTHCGRCGAPLAGRNLRITTDARGVARRVCRACHRRRQQGYRRAARSLAKAQRAQPA